MSILKINRIISKDILLKFLRHFISYLFTIFLLVSLVFILLRLAPGDPVQRFVSPELSSALAEEVRKSFGLDRPVIEQYFIFIRNIFTGDFGISYNFRSPVWTVIMNSLPFTVIFSFISFILQIIISLWMVVIVSKRRAGFIDRILSKLSVAFYAIPTMIIGIVLIYLFAFTFNLLPSSDLQSVNSEDFNIFERFFDYTSHMILPLITLSLPGILVFYNYLRSNIESSYNKNYVLFLKANGTPEKIIFWRHVLPNSLGPLVSVLGAELGILLGGALITETIFSLPGMGRLTVSAILTRDYPLVAGCAFVSGIFVLAANFLADIVKIKFDNRLRVESY
ncbi:MAG: hypothetical protein CVV24_14685 [Ignavibacteriae bacterium HGW-Ignavibacteriae-3]|nr:MAG: hypothetical protein CVV24_14685 [Ignavibacteriae bacterium HGW-Ignavibacteriae-3]